MFLMEKKNHVVVLVLRCYHAGDVNRHRSGSKNTRTIKASNRRDYVLLSHFMINIGNVLHKGCAQTTTHNIPTSEPITGE